MRLARLIATMLLAALTACTGPGPFVPPEDAPQFQQAGPPFPYNSFYCP